MVAVNTPPRLPFRMTREMCAIGGKTRIKLSLTRGIRRGDSGGRGYSQERGRSQVLVAVLLMVVNVAIVSLTRRHDFPVVSDTAAALRTAIAARASAAASAAVKYGVHAEIQRRHGRSERRRSMRCLSRNRLSGRSGRLLNDLMHVVVVRCRRRRGQVRRGNRRCCSVARRRLRRHVRLQRRVRFYRDFRLRERFFVRYNS